MMVVTDDRTHADGIQEYSLTMRKNRLILLLVATQLLMVCAYSQGNISAAGISDEALAWLDDEHRRSLDVFGHDPDIMVRRGLLADKKHRYVDLLATATGAGPDSLVDTFVTVAGSDPQRSIAVTPVSPAGVQEALEFIGMAPGHPVDLSRALYWPKGERVVMTFYWSDPGGGRFTQSVRAEKLLTDVIWDEHLPVLGLRFVGPAAGSAPLTGAGPIATSFNAQNTILEVPYRVGGPAQVGQLVANADYQFPAGQKLRIRMRPEYGGERKRVRDYVADVAPGTSENAQQLSNLAVRLSSPDGTEVASGSFESIFVFLEALIKDGKEPYLQFRYDDRISVQSVRNVARLTSQFLAEQEIRIEPNDSHLFYSAFLPQESWRDPRRRGRGSQPLEIHWDSPAGGTEFSGQVIQYSQSAPGTPQQLSFASVEDLTAVIERGKPWHTDGVFFMATPDMRYGTLRQAFASIRTDFPNVYVFF